MTETRRTIADVNGNRYPLYAVTCCGTLPSLPLDSASTCPVCGTRTFAAED